MRKLLNYHQRQADMMWQIY